jgi:aerobic carbon-monoxide dehydrogenase medium subunit
MKAPNFGYVRPRCLAEALEVLGQHAGSAMPLAGGQSLLAALNMRLSAPQLLVDISELNELKAVDEAGDTVRIGALVRHCELLRSPLIARCLPLVSEAASHIGHVAIRNRGTIGGSLANADPAAELPACAVVLGGSLILACQAGRREIPASEFFTGLMETTLRPNELIIEVRLPKQDPSRRWGFLEINRRRGDFAIVGLAGFARITDGRVNDADLVYFGCSDRPKRATRVSAALEGRELAHFETERLMDAVGEDLQVFDSPGWKASTKVYLAAVLTQRLLRTMNA